MNDKNSNIDDKDNIIMKKLDEIAKISYGVPIERYKEKKEHVEAEEYLIIDTKNVQDNVINQKAIKTCELYITNTIEKHTLKKDTILMRTIHPYYNVHIEENQPYTLPNRTVLVIKIKEEFKEKIISKYLSYFLNSEYVKKQLAQKEEGAAKKQLNKALILDLNVKIPDLTKQREYVWSVDVINTRIILRKQEISQLKELKKYYINKVEFLKEEEE